MKRRRFGAVTRLAAASLAGLLLLASCGRQAGPNLLDSEPEEKTAISIYSPMEKSIANAEHTARTAFDRTVLLAESQLDIRMDYIIYTAETYQDKTYDDVALDRARNGMDDMYLLNPDTIKTLGEEGLLVDLSGLTSAKNLRDIIRVANTIDGKLVAIPQEVVAYGLFINQDIFDRLSLPLPNTPEEFLECCRVLQENGYETPIGANRWWLEIFVLAQAYADLYNGGNTEAEIEALNSGEAKYSDYMRTGFMFLQQLIDKGYVDAQKALVSEAIEAEREGFLAQETPIVMAYWGAANTETAYGKTDFNMTVIGFPSSRGQMPVMPMTGLSVLESSKNKQTALEVLDVILSDEALQIYSEINRVISPSKNVEVDCVPALRPLNERINEGVFVLGANASMDLEQWGNTCLIVRQLLGGATVEECMAEFDRLQAETIAQKNAG